MKANNWFKRWVKRIYVVISTITALLSSAFTSLAHALHWTGLFPWGLFVFCISSSAVLIQILFSVLNCNETLDNMASNESVIFPPKSAEQIRNELTSLLNNLSEDVCRLKIICYGTSGYDNLIDDVYNGTINRDLILDIMVCSPDKAARDSDKIIIEKFVETMKGKENLHFHYAKCLPTIRACVVYDKKNVAIWSCLQTYCYNCTDEIFPSAQYRSFYSIVGRKENHYILKNNVEIIEKEFDRLKTNVVNLRGVPKTSEIC